MANRMRINGGPWLNLPRYPMGRPLKFRCMWCNRETSSHISCTADNGVQRRLVLCGTCKPSLDGIIEHWREHRRRIAQLSSNRLTAPLL